MSTPTATNSASSPSTIAQAKINFGSKSYTAFWTASNVALIGESTISVGGPAVQLSGGWASLDASKGVLHQTGLIPVTTTIPMPTSKTIPKAPTSTSILAEVSAGSVVIPLESTTLTVIAMPSGLVVDSVTIDTAGFQWVIGSQTLSPEYDGIVVASGLRKDGYLYQLITVTSGVIPTGPASTEAMPSPTTRGNVVSTPATTFSSTSTVTQESSSASLRGVKVALLAWMSLLVILVAV